MQIIYLNLNSFFTKKPRYSRLKILCCYAFSSMLLFSNASHAKTAQVLEELVQQALEAKPDVERGKKLYRNCAVCHSPEGWGTRSGHYPQIAGQHKSVIIKQLTDIHKGNRDNPTMLPFTSPLFSLGPQALADISAYINKLPMVPNNNIGFGHQLAEGKKLYEDNCKQCHEANGEGKANKFYPRIHGQHFSYLERQLHWIKNGKRRNADDKMVEQIKNFNFRQLELIADYISRLKPDKSLMADTMYYKNPDFRSGFYNAPRD